MKLLLLLSFFIIQPVFIPASHARNRKIVPLKDGLLKYHSWRDQQEIRFIHFGDGGTGTSEQALVAKAMSEYCQNSGGCHFALYAGDIIYPKGISDTQDPQLQTKFEIRPLNRD
jgi:hypothetical protein